SRRLPGAVRHAAAAAQLLRVAHRDADAMIRLTCRQVIARLADYIDAALGGLMRARVSLHLLLCSECRAYLETYRRTIALVGAAGGGESACDARHRVTRPARDAIR